MIYLARWFSAFLAALSQLGQGLAAGLAPILGAALILLIGWFLAFFLGRVVKKVLGQDSIPWDRILSSIGLSAVLKDRLGLSPDVGALLGWLTKWFLIVASFTAAMSIVGLEGINRFLGEAAGFLPGAITAAVIVFIGFFLGTFIDQVVTRLIGALGLKADVAGWAGRWIMIAFGILAAARFLNLRLDVLWPRFLDFLVFAGALAVGLGLSSRAGEWLAKIQSRLSK